MTKRQSESDMRATPALAVPQSSASGPKPKPEPPLPASRTLRAFGFDPSLSTEMANYEVAEVEVRVPWERDRLEERDEGLVLEPGLLPGPIGDYLEVVDVDP